MIAAVHHITQDLPKVSHEEQASRACRGGAKWVQLRMKGSPVEEVIAVGKKVMQVCDAHGAKLIINDHLEAVLPIQAAGVHLGKTDESPVVARQKLGPDCIIGATCNTFDDIREVHSIVNYVGVGPFRFTSTKKNLSPIIGLENYKVILEHCQKAGIATPVIAIGGILPEDVPALMHTGVHGIAVSSGINLAESPEEACRNYLTAIHSTIQS